MPLPSLILVSRDGIFSVSSIAGANLNEILQDDNEIRYVLNLYEASLFVAVGPLQPFLGILCGGCICRALELLASLNFFFCINKLWYAFNNLIFDFQISLNVPLNMYAVECAEKLRSLFAIYLC